MLTNESLKCILDMFANNHPHSQQNTHTHTHTHTHTQANMLKINNFWKITFFCSFRQQHQQRQPLLNHYPSESPLNKVYVWKAVTRCCKSSKLWVEKHWGRILLWHWELIWAIFFASNKLFKYWHNDVQSFSLTQKNQLF